MKYCANMHTMFQGFEYTARYDQARKHGFAVVETLFPYFYAKRDEVQRAKQRNDLTVLGLDFFPGDFFHGEIGMINNPARNDDYRRGVELTLQYAEALGARQINCLVGKRLPDVSYEEQYDNMLRNIVYSAEQLRPHGMVLLIEPINSKDHPGYLVDTCDKAHAVIRAAGQPNVFLQFDLYHGYRMGEDLTGQFLKYKDLIRHVHVSDYPGRTEPGKGEIPFDAVLPTIERNYDGYVGLEYKNEDSIFGTLKPSYL
jgi:hydroxypyruvate isomerase